MSPGTPSGHCARWLLCCSLCYQGSCFSALLRVPAEAILRYVAYLPCASVAILIASGLAVDLLGPLLGLHEPLRRWPLLIVLNLTLPMLALFGRRAPSSCELKTSALIGRCAGTGPCFCRSPPLQLPQGLTTASAMPWPSRSSLPWQWSFPRARCWPTHFPSVKRAFSFTEVAFP